MGPLANRGRHRTASEAAWKRWTDLPSASEDLGRDTRDPVAPHPFVDAGPPHAEASPDSRDVPLAECELALQRGLVDAECPRGSGDNPFRALNATTEAAKSA